MPAFLTRGKFAASLCTGEFAGTSSIARRYGQLRIKMRNILTTLTLLIFWSCGSSKQFPYYRKINSRFVQIDTSSSIYYCRYETTNGEYNNFLQDIKNTDQQLWKDCLYDSILWSEKFPHSYNGSYVRHYFNHPAFRNQPVLSISHKGALEFCKWATINYNFQKRRKYKKVLFRLPTNQEFEELINSVEIKFDSDDVSDYTEFNFNLRFENNFAADGGLYPTYVYNYIQNEKMFCSIIGNVCEFTQTGESIGGNWFCYPSESKLYSKYESPDPRVGFRVIMEIEEK